MEEQDSKYSLDEIVAFLTGSATLDELWFGERDPERNYLISGEIIRRGLRKVILITVTDGKNTLVFENSGDLELSTNKPMSEPAIKKFV